MKKSYLAYLLRLWKINGEGQSGWRGSLEDPHSGKMLGFPNVEALIDYICKQVNNWQDDEEDVQDMVPRE